MAKRNVTVNGFDLQDANFITQNIQHEQGHVRDINQVPLASEPGTVVTDVEDREKLILISGTFVTASQTALETGLDTLKRSITRVDEDEEVEIVIDHAGTTRVYRGIWQNPESLVVRENFNIKDIGYTLEYLVTGYGESPTTRTFSLLTVTSSPSSTTYALEGTAPAPVLFNMDIGTASTMNQISITNTDTNQSITLDHPSGTFSDDDNVMFNGETKEVRLNDAIQDFSGVFIDFDPRATNQENNITYTFAGATTIDQEQTATGGTTATVSCLLDEKSETGASEQDCTSTTWVAQSFVPTQSGVIKFVELFGRGVSSTQNISIGIADDAAGDPSGAGTGTSVDFNTTSSWNTSNTFQAAGGKQVTAGNTYWIVAQNNDAGTSKIQYNSSNVYPFGTAKVSTDSGSSWAALGVSSDLLFRVYTDYPIFAQSFQVSGAMNISQIELYLKGLNYASQSPTRDITCEIWTDSAGDPDVLVANATKTITADNISDSSAAWTPFIFDTQPSLIGATVYHIVVRVEGINTGMIWYRRSSGDSDYANGTDESYNQFVNTWSNGTSDFAFKIYQQFSGINVEITPTYLPLWQ